MKLQYYIFAILFATAFILGTTMFIGDLQTSTGTVVNTSYNQTYDKIDDLMNLSSEATDKLQGADVDVTANQALQLATFPVLKMVFNSFDIMISLIEDLSVDMGLPPWILPIILTIISVGLLFAIVNAFFGRDT